VFSGNPPEPNGVPFYWLLATYYDAANPEQQTGSREGV
jgi:hypothetical protein